MAGTISGTIRLVSKLKTTIPSDPGLTDGYDAPAGADDTVTYGPGTGPGQANRLYSHGATATASPAVFDLSTIVTADGQVGLSHWRELIVYNNDAVHDLVWDFTVANANTAMFSSGGTGVKLTIPPGGHHRFTKPLGTSGYVVDGTHKVVSLDPGANTVAYRFIALGD